MVFCILEATTSPVRSLRAGVEAAGVLAVSVLMTVGYFLNLFLFLFLGRGGLFGDAAFDLEAEAAFAQNRFQLGDVLADFVEAARFLERAGLLLEAQVEVLLTSVLLLGDQFRVGEITNF